jgi:hypothetical protein
MFIDERLAEMVMLPAFETVEEAALFESFLPPGYRCTLQKASQAIVKRARELQDEKAVITGPLSCVMALDPRWDATEDRERDDSVKSESSPNPIPIEPPYSPQELAEAKLALIRMTQQHYLPGITACLKEESLSAREDYPEEVRRPVFTLGLRLDSDGIIRSYGRTALSSMRAQRRKMLDPHLFCPEVSKPLILIPGTGFLGECVMYTAHLATMHWGRNNMTSWTRSEYWVVNPSKLASRVKRHCTVCTNYDAAPFTTEPSGLPEKRISPCYPFQHIGLDYVSVRFERKKHTIEGKLTDQEKYIIICVFTCMVTRAVHLEYADDYTKEEFARVFKKFCDRYCTPETVISDNGSNFEPIAKTLKFPLDKGKELFPNITWQFLPRQAPNWGGFYERLNLSIKNCLAKEFPRLANKPYMEIESALAAIAHRFNSRPLWIVSMDRDDVEMLTPNHFLNVGPTGSFGPPSESNIKGLRSYHEAQQKHVDETWDRFFRSYISELRVHHKWDQTARAPHVKIGDFVTIPQDKILKTRWPIARITGFVEDSSDTGRKKAAFIETYVSDRVNTRLKNTLFGPRTRIKDLTPGQKRQVVGCFIPNKKAVTLDKLYPYEMWEDTEVVFPVPIVRDELPTNFPGHPEVLTDTLSEFESQKRDKFRRKAMNRQLAIAKAAVKKRPRSPDVVDESDPSPRCPVTRDETGRPRRKAAKYNRDYRDLADGIVGLVFSEGHVDADADSDSEMIE